MKIIAKAEYYAPTFLDFSMSTQKKPTGKLSATLFTRIFSLIEDKKGKRHVRAQRSFRVVNWEKDTEVAKARAVKTAIKGLREWSDLDANPPIDFIPDEVESYLLKEHRK